MRALPAMKRLFLMPSPWRGEAGIVSTDRHQALVRIAEAAAPALGFAATTVIALIDLDQTVEWIFPPLAQRVAQLVRHQPCGVVAQRQLARQKQRRHAALVLRHQPGRGKPFAQRRAGAVKHRPGSRRMLPAAAGALENPRPRRELIRRPPGAPRAHEALGPAQLCQRRKARRLVTIAVHELEKSGHHNPCATPMVGAGYPLIANISRTVLPTLP